VAYREQERRKALLEKLQDLIDGELDNGAAVPLSLTLKPERLAELGEEVGLNLSQTEYLFVSLVDERFVRGRVASDRSAGFRHAILYGLTDRGLRQIGHLPPADTPLEDLLERIAGPDERQGGRL
jgi:hypothetical protein